MLASDVVLLEQKQLADQHSIHLKHGSGSRSSSSSSSSSRSSSSGRSKTRGKRPCEPAENITVTVNPPKRGATLLVMDTVESIYIKSGFGLSVGLNRQYLRIRW